MRVRELLSSLNADQGRALKKLLPKVAVPDAAAKGKFPATLLSLFPKSDQYSITGLIAESLLGTENPSCDGLCALAQHYNVDLTTKELTKLTKSKTTSAFLQSICTTRTKMLEISRGSLQTNQEVHGNGIVGHPDFRTETQLFEVKTTAQLKTNWSDFLLQTFAYAALAPETTDLYIVLPLQELVWHYEIKDWKNRDAYKTLLERYANPTVEEETNFAKTVLMLETFRIGSHIPKLKSLVATVESTPPTKPFQIFLTNPQSTALSITDAELAACAQVIGVRKSQVYIHSPYIINLCYEPGTIDDYPLQCLIKHLKYGAAMGAKGVVVHVGKSTKQTLDSALNHMLMNIAKAAAEATPECPLLLETPAGQGTEVLTEFKDFVEFVTSIQSSNLKICIDTCHVFACGHNPLTYIQNLINTNKHLLHLIHFNDSKTPCGSRLDRHAFCGSGHIGFDAMKSIAELCSQTNIPMVVE
jgi:deoxyribonuclease-4